MVHIDITLLLCINKEKKKIPFYCRGISGCASDIISAPCMCMLEAFML